MVGVVTDAVIATDVGTRFLEALRRRDYDALGSGFAPAATLWSIVPPGLREDDGPDAIVARFRRWTEEIDEYEVLEAEATPCADVLRLRWAIRGVDPGASVPDPRPSMFEQTAYERLQTTPSRRCVSPARASARFPRRSSDHCGIAPVRALTQRERQGQVQGGGEPSGR